MRSVNRLRVLRHSGVASTTPASSATAVATIGVLAHQQRRHASTTATSAPAAATDAKHIPGSSFVDSSSSGWADDEVNGWDEPSPKTSQNNDNNNINSAWKSRDTSTGQWGSEATKSGGWGTASTTETSATSSSSWGNFAAPDATTASQRSTAPTAASLADEEASMMADDAQWDANNITNSSPVKKLVKSEGEDSKISGGASSPNKNNNNAAFDEDEEYSVFEEAELEAPSPARAHAAYNQRSAKNKFEKSASSEISAESAGATTESSIPIVAAENNENSAEEPKEVTAAERKMKAAPIIINVAARYDARLTVLNKVSVDTIMALPAEDAVLLTSNYVHMHHFVRNCRRRRIRISNVPTLFPLKEEALISAAIRAIEKKDVPLEIAIKILRAPFLFDRLHRYRRYLATLIRGWAVEVILGSAVGKPVVGRSVASASADKSVAASTDVIDDHATVAAATPSAEASETTAAPSNTDVNNQNADSTIGEKSSTALEAFTPSLARKVLSVANHFDRDARVIGALAQKAIEDLDTLTTREIIQIMHSIAATRIRPPSSYWSLLLRRVLRNLHASTAATATASPMAKEGATDGAVDDSESATALVSSSQPKEMTSVEAFRILDVCSRVGVFSDVNTLAQLSEYAWRQIAKNATAAEFPPRVRFSSRVAYRRLQRVSGLSATQFFRLIQLSSTLGTNFNAGRGVITDKVIIPLTYHLNDHHVSELIEALSMSKARYAPAIQAVIDRVVKAGSSSPASLMHVSRLLRSIAQHNEVCAQLRLTKFFDLLEEVCSQKYFLRTVQMTRLVEDIYYITRRFARDAPIVKRMQKVVEVFCGYLTVATKRGVVAIDQINTVLDHTVMMGMSKNATAFPNTRALRNLRKDLYANTKAGAFPAGYKDKVDPSVRFLYNDLVFVNQSQVLFHQQVDRGAVAQIQQIIQTAGPYNVLNAIYIYNELHGKAMPLSPFLQTLLLKYLRHMLSDIKTGQSLQEISSKIAIGRSKESKNNNNNKASSNSTDRVITSKELEFFAAALSRRSLVNLKSQSFYLEFLNATAVALGGHEEVQAKVNELQKGAIF